MAFVNKFNVNVFNFHIHCTKDHLSFGSIGRIFQNFQSFFARMKGIYKKGAENEKLRFVAFGHYEVNRTTSARNSLISNGNDQQNFLMEPKQKIHELFALPKIKNNDLAGLMLTST